MTDSNNLTTDAQAIIQKARDLLALPVLETSTKDGTVVKPISPAHLAGVASALKAAYELLERGGEESEEEDGLFSAAPTLPGQVESREAYSRLEAAAAWSPWWADYLALRRERNEAGKAQWNWREAVYIAWSSLPKRLRWPATQEELARQVLGLTNDRTIREWKLKRPELQERIVQLTGEMLMKHRAEVLDALVQVAATPDAKAYSDRRLFLEMTGDYRPKQTIEGELPLLIKIDR